MPTEALGGADQRKIVIERLAKAYARIDPDMIAFNPGGFGGSGARQEIGFDLRHHIVIMRRGLHGLRVALFVHQYNGTS